MAFSAMRLAPTAWYFDQRRGGGFGERAAGADGGHAFVGLDHVAVAADHVRVLDVGHQQQRFQMTQHAVGAPFLGQFHHGARQVAVVLLELGFEAREQRERIGGGSGESGQDLVVIQPAELFGGRFQNFLSPG